jgi:hypothetical protein
MQPIHTECNRFDEEGIFILAPLNNYVLHARLAKKRESIVISIASPNKEWAHNDLRKELAKGYTLIEITGEQQIGPLVTKEYLEQSIRIESILSYLEDSQEKNLYFKLLPEAAVNKIARYLLSKHNLK